MFKITPRGGSAVECASFKVDGNFLYLYNAAGVALKAFAVNPSYPLDGFTFSEYAADGDTQGTVVASEIGVDDTEYTDEIKINPTTKKLYAPAYTPGDIASMTENTLDAANVYAVGQTLTVDESYSTTPASVELVPHWERSADGSSSWTDITGAAEETYLLTEDDWDKYVRRVAFAQGRAVGTATTEASDQIMAAFDEAVISGTLRVGSEITATPATLPAEGPTGMTYGYQWMSCDTTAGTFENVTGATGSTAGAYVLTEADYGKYLKCAVDGDDTVVYGSVDSDITGPIAALLASAAITGDAVVGNTLTAVPTLSPASAKDLEYTFQWKICDTVDGSYTNITGATNATYVVLAEHYTKFFKAAITADGVTVTSDATAAVVGKIASAAITGNKIVGETLAVTPTLSPEACPPGPDYEYQWYASADGVTGWLGITGATGSTYVLTEDEWAKYLKATITATGAAQGTATSAVTTIIKADLASVTVTGGLTAGDELTATPVLSPIDTPTGAIEYTWEWVGCATTGGTYAALPNGDDSTYELYAGLANMYIKAHLIATGDAVGDVYSDYVGPVVAG